MSNNAVVVAVAPPSPPSPPSPLSLSTTVRLQSINNVMRDGQLERAFDLYSDSTNAALQVMNALKGGNVCMVPACRKCNGIIATDPRSPGALFRMCVSGAKRLDGWYLCAPANTYIKSMFLEDKQFIDAVIATEELQKTQYCGQLVLDEDQGADKEAGMLNVAQAFKLEGRQEFTFNFAVTPGFSVGLPRCIVTLVHALTMKINLSTITGSPFGECGVPNAFLKIAAADRAGLLEQLTKKTVIKVPQASDGKKKVRRTKDEAYSIGVMNAEDTVNLTVRIGNVWFYNPTILPIFKTTATGISNRLKCPEAEHGAHSQEISLKTFHKLVNNSGVKAPLLHDIWGGSDAEEIQMCISKNKNMDGSGYGVSHYMVSFAAPHHSKNKHKLVQALMVVADEESDEFPGMEQTTPGSNVYSVVDHQVVLLMLPPHKNEGSFPNAKFKAAALQMGPKVHAVTEKVNGSLDSDDDDDGDDGDDDDDNDKTEGKIRRFKMGAFKEVLNDYRTGYGINTIKAFNEFKGIARNIVVFSQLVNLAPGWDRNKILDKYALACSCTQAFISQVIDDAQESFNISVQQHKSRITLGTTASGQALAGFRRVISGMHKTRAGEEDIEENKYALLVNLGSQIGSLLVSVFSNKEEMMYSSGGQTPQNRHNVQMAKYELLQLHVTHGNLASEIVSQLLMDARDMPATALQTLDAPVETRELTRLGAAPVVVEEDGGVTDDDEQGHCSGDGGDDDDDDDDDEEEVEKSDQEPANTHASPASESNKSDSDSDGESDGEDEDLDTPAKKSRPQERSRTPSPQSSEDKGVQDDLEEGQVEINSQEDGHQTVVMVPE